MKKALQSVYGENIQKVYAGYWHIITKDVPRGVGFIHCPLNIMGKEYGGVGAERNIGLNSLFDVVYGHSHKSNDVRVPKIGTNNYTRVINVGCSMPDGHIEDYAKLGVTGWWWGIVDVQVKCMDNAIITRIK